MASSLDDLDNLNRTNLIVNYLPQSLTDEEFRSMFLSIGPLRASKVIRDRATGYSYGFGFVDYANEQDAERAIQTLNGLQLQNKKIKVAFSRTGEDIKGANLYIRNLPRSMSEDDLSAMFADYGKVVQCRILKDTYTGLSKGVGFVLYNKSSEAEAAISALNNQIPEGGTEVLNIKHAEDNRGKARPPVVVMGGGGGQGGPAGGGGVGGRPPPYGPGGPHGGYGGPGAGYGGPGGPGPGPGPMRGRLEAGGRYRYNPVTAGGGPPQVPEGYVMFVYNIGAEADERALWQLFSPFGAVQKVNIMRDFQKNVGKGYGFVTMSNYHEAVNAITGLNGYRYEGRPLQVSFKSQKGNMM